MMNLHTFFFGALTGLGVGVTVVGGVAVHAIDRLRAQLEQYQDGYRHAVARARVLERKGGQR